MYDPVALAETTEKIVVKGKLRKYYRKARIEKWYNGIVSAYCCGCNLRCVFCWSGSARDHTDSIGRFYSPEQIYDQLAQAAAQSGYKQLRLTGNEPTLGKDHLFGILELVEQNDYLFILETNGILIGSDRHYAKQLSRFQRVHTRISLKATDPEAFSRFTGARPEAFDLQLQALRNALDANISFNPAIMTSFSSTLQLRKLEETLKMIDRSLVERLEKEHVILYPPVAKRLEQANLEVRSESI